MPNLLQGLRAVFDDFLPDAQAIRQMALAAPFRDFHGHDGEVYKRVALVRVPGFQEAIEAALDEPVHMLGMGYRLNFGGELPNAAVHSDIGWGTHAAVLYLCDAPDGVVTGTAFWRHRLTCTTRLKPGDLALFEDVRNDWNHHDRWSLDGFVPHQFNRATIYDGMQYHSRFPFAAWGEGPEDGRLVAVAFFTPRSCQ